MIYVISFIAIVLFVLYCDRQVAIADLKKDLASALKQSEDLLAASPAAVGAEVAKVFSVLKKHL